MSFLYPSFLFALSALSIPVIVHLFNFRRYKKVYFTNVRFLKEVQQETRSKSTLKRILILLSRLLALSCLVFAFAQPYIPGNHTLKKGVRNISIYIDNSFSMEAVGKNGSLLEDAKRRAAELVRSAAATDRFVLLTNDFYSSSISQSREQTLEAIDKINISPSSKKLDEINKRLVSDNRAPGNPEFFFFSDFQKSAFKGFMPDTSVETSLVLLGNNASQNVLIDSCFVESPYFQQGSVQKLHVKIRNLSDKEIENGSLKLVINNKEIAPAGFHAAAYSPAEALISFPARDTGLQQAYVCLEDFPVTFDDTLFFSFHVSHDIPALVINKKDEPSATYLRSLFSNDSLFNYRELDEQRIDFSYFKTADIIVLNALQGISSGLSQELKKYILNGGSVLLFPAAEADIESYNAFFTSLNVNVFVDEDTTAYRLENRNIPKDFYEGVFEKIPANMDMPLVHDHYVERVNSRSGEISLLRLINGQPFLSLYQKGKGKLYVCSVPLNEESSNFGRHALFIPTLIKIAVLSRPAPPLYYENGKNEAIEAGDINLSGDQALHISSPQKKTDFIPEMKVTENGRTIFTHGLPVTAGNYLLQHNKKSEAALAFNYNRTESDLSSYTKDELEELIRNAAWKNLHVINLSKSGMQAGLPDIGGGTKLWKLFIILTLLFLAAETLLIKFLKQ